MRDLLAEFVSRYGRLPTEVDPDYLEFLNMTKYRIMAMPDFKPSKCANCGSCKADGRKYIDFGLEIDWYGIVYLCGLCLTDIADKMGLFDQLKNHIDEALTEVQHIESLKAQGVELHETLTRKIEELNDYYASLHSLGDGNISDRHLSLVPSEISNGPDEPRTDETKPRVVKSTSSSRRKDIPSFTDLLGSTDS
jgi:hypothetical protein